MAYLDLKSDFIEVIKETFNDRGLTFEPQEDYFDSILQAWNTMHRLLSQIKWSVQISHELSSKISELSEELQNGLTEFRKKAETGQDLTPHLSRSVKRQDYADLMYYDWGIYHFHLGTESQSDGFVKRSGALLFVLSHPEKNELYFIDILQHKFSEQNLLAILESNWSEVLDHYALKGISSARAFRDNEIGALRTKGVNIPYQTPGGRILGAMGGGISCSTKTSPKIVRDADWTVKTLDLLPENDTVK